MQKHMMSNSSRGVLVPVLLDSMLTACGSGRPTYAGRSQQVAGRYRQLQASALAELLK